MVRIVMVWQFLPSISSCIGGFSPQRYVWRICIGLHCAPRFMLAVAYYNYHTQIHIEHWLYNKLAALCTVLHIIENFSLVHMRIFLYERKSLKYKIILFIFNVTSFFVAVYLFFRHNWYCERGVYSLFAAFEYMIVLSNIGFHSTAAIDFKKEQVIIQSDKIPFNMHLSDKKVWQFLPSISSCIGGFSPQRYVWRICIGLHCAPRFMLAVAYYNYHTQIHIEHWFYQKLAALCTVLHIIENFSLFYMLFTCIIYKWGLSSLKSVTNSERKSLKYKIILFIFNVTSFFVAVYLFFRHNWYCERGVYSLFAAFEYMIVLSNIGFHSTAAIDFKKEKVIIQSDSLPTFGFFFCVIWSLYFDFKASTATHCKVWQFLPSISSCIGGFSPQRYVWRICIGLHCAPRFMLAVAYYNYHTQIHIEHWFYQKLAALCTVLHIIENFSLVHMRICLLFL
ncbi:hypothetical protein KUTeg_024800 [Tegillarca granosa]|uniref:CWH43-like N-terminal domain-containing protein n=1 Tax=Tegillarca granosa TaxID=220873 RepID=A0ABQ9DYY1_TEGGR|nr:hypothetical protein KUTeg_024800 [Tegillarca granosa]